MKQQLKILAVLGLFLANSLAAQVPYTVTYKVQSSTDDAEESISSGAVNLTSSDLEMVQENTEQIIGIRFAGINIPQGATINSAFIQFTVDETDDVATSLNIKGELVDNSPTFTNTLNNISSRVTTSLEAVWENIPAWNTAGDAGDDQRTPDLKDVVQEIVNQSGWTEGNALSFIISGMGKRNAVSFNNGNNTPAELIINFDLDSFVEESFPFGQNSLWKYNDSGADLGTDWVTLEFDDSSWAFGAGEFGYGDGDETTTLNFGGNADDKFITYYFRKTFNVADATQVEALSLDLLRDDGAVIYLNGVEILRDNMPEGTIDFQTIASNTVGGSDESTYFNTIFENSLVDGTNIIAVEIHQRSATSSDLGFDLALSEGILPAFDFISKNDTWKYDTTLMDLDTAWRMPEFVDTLWATGNGKFGYGDNNEQTTLSFGNDPDNKFITYYFRKKFNVENPSQVGIIKLGLLRDDGAIVYINGAEVLRDNMPEGPVDYTTLSASIVSGSDEGRYFEFELPASVLTAGENTIAVEIHQRSGNSSDLGFDLFLNAEEAENPLIQLIHNSPDPGLQAVDVFVDAFGLGNFVSLGQGVPIPFRLATEFLDDLPAGTHRIAISPFGQNDFEWSIQEVTFEANKRYVVMAEGVRDPSSFNTSINGEAIGFRFIVNEIPDADQVTAGETIVLLHHAAPDVPNIRLIAVGAGEATGDFPEGIPYGFDITGGGVASLPYPRVQVTNNNTDVIFGEYKVDLVPFTGQVVTIFTSGFISPDGNTGINDANFGLYLAADTGTGFAIELPAPDPPVPGNIQFIHNSPDPEISDVDLYLNGELVFQSLRYKESTPLLPIPAGNNRIAVSPRNGSVVDTAWSATDVFVDFDLNITTFRDEGRNYVAAAFGVRNTADFTNEVNSGVGFGLQVQESRCGLDDPQPTQTDLTFFHGTLDAPAIDIVLDDQFIPIVNNLSYGSFAPTYSSLPENLYQLDIKDEDNTGTLFRFNMNLEGRGSEVLTFIASGLLNPADGQPAFSFFGLNCFGEVFALDQISSTQSLQEIAVSFFPNPVKERLWIDSPIQLDRFEITNILGQSVFSSNAIAGKNEVDISQLTKGVYSIKVVQEGKVYASQFVKQ